MTQLIYKTKLSFIVFKKNDKNHIVNSFCGLFLPCEKDAIHSYPRNVF